MKNKLKIYFVGGNRNLKTGGGANISLSALENELIKLNYNVIPVMGINVKDALSFCKLSHISFNPLLKFTCKEIIKNWQDAFILEGIIVVGLSTLILVLTRPKQKEPA